jgi:D-threo-aldose 1-dehydrogenase
MQNRTPYGSTKGKNDVTTFDRSKWLRPFGHTGLTVSAIGMGGAHLGNMADLFGYEVTEDDAVALVRRVMDGPICLLDTSNGYAAGRSEQRIGRAIREHGGLPAGFVISTKVDARDGDYSGERVRASVRESMERLSIGTLPVVFLHDPEFHPFEMMTGPGGAVEVLVAMRDSGEIGHIGVAGGDTREISRYVDLGVFEALLLHNRWTLVDRSAGPLFDRAAGDGLAVINAAVYGGGLLASPGGGNGTYAYQPARDAVREAAAAMAQVCAGWGTDLATAALRFSLRDPRITATIAGFTKESTLARTLGALDAELPDPFWQELDALTPDPAHWLDSSEPVRR